MTGLDERPLRQALERLAKEKQVAFALLLCERLVPAFEEFSREVDFDDSLYRTGLDSVWHYLRQGGKSSNYARMAEQCRDHAPDTEEFSHPLTSAALNAALSIAATIRLLADDDADHVVEAAGLARDTAALYAQAAGVTPPRSLSFDDIMKHPIVQRELRQQAEDLKFVETLPADEPQGLISLVKDRAAEAPELLPPRSGR